MTAGLLLALGVVLCFAGAWSVRLAVMASGFGVGWLLADGLGTDFLTALLVGASAAAITFLVTLLASKVLLFVAGAIAGAVVGAKLFVLLDGDRGSWLLAVVFVPAVAIVFGVMADRFGRRFLVWGTAFAGAALILSGLAEVSGLDLEQLRTPDDALWGVVATGVWVLLAVVGRTAQVRLRGRRSE